MYPIMININRYIVWLRVEINNSIVKKGISPLLIYFVYELNISPKIFHIKIIFAKKYRVNGSPCKIILSISL